MKLIQKLANEDLDSHFLNEHEGYNLSEQEIWMNGFLKCRELFLERFGDLEAGNRYGEMSALGEEEA